MMIKTVCIAALFAALPAALPAAELLVSKEKSSFAVGVKASPPHSFDVLLKDYAAAVTLDPEGEVSAATFSFRFDDLDSDNSKRDKKMRDWVDTKSFPDVAFTLSEIRRSGDERIAVGEIQMHGVSHPVEFPFTLAVEGDQATLSGAATLDYREWNLEIISLLFFKVKPELDIHFTLRGALQN